MPEVLTLDQLLKKHTKPGELYEKLPEGKVRCFSCGHRCLIPDGRDGVCRVRFNRGGTLFVPHGYVGALQCDPIEKKPFFHALPGTDALSFGMLGCDLHCPYCVVAGTKILTSTGPRAIGDIFDRSIPFVRDGNSVVARVPSFKVLTHTGQPRQVAKTFRHRYAGSMVSIKPMGLSALKVTPGHEFLMVPNSDWIESSDLVWKRASELVQGDRLVVLKNPLKGSRYLSVPIEKVARYSFDGYVYNLEVEEDHSYLAESVFTHNCQNWDVSQAIRDPTAGGLPMFVTPDGLVKQAKRLGASTVASTYNEPLITSEWAVEVFRVARGAGFKTAYISNGNATEEVLRYLKPWVDLYKVDLKSFDDKHYRVLGGQLEVVKWTIRRLYEMGFWLEIVTLIVPDFNDSDEELKQIADFLSGISVDIPWHVTAFHPDYKMTDTPGTPAETLIRAAHIGQAAGLRYIYAGNLPGEVDRYENTYCPSCRKLLIERFGYEILQNNLQDGRCPSCKTLIPGIWK